MRACVVNGLDTRSVSAKIIFNSLYSYLNVNGLITKNQSGFRPGDSTINQLLFLVNEIHEAFDDPKSLEVRAVFPETF